MYYTPTYIVDYIVRHTIEALLKDKTPRQAATLKILDPACGSGSFLIGAYQYLLDWHRDQYLADGPTKHVKILYQGLGGQWRLTTAERKRILLNHIYGVDIDLQAVEVTKLSLLLKVLEGENQQTLMTQRQLFQERALPDLGHNIKCGNSLISSDFYENRQMILLSEEERSLVNVFDWRAEFPKVFQGKDGGFDAVIGNPPYIRSQALGALQRHYYSEQYQAATGTYDIYVLFIEHALTLMTQRARAGFILSNKFFTTDYGEGIRRILGEHRFVEKLVDFEDAQVFADAGTYTALLFLSRMPIDCPEYTRLGAVYRGQGSVGLVQALASSDLPFAPLTLTEDGSRWTLAAGRSGQTLSRLQRTYPSLLSLKPHIFQGLKTSADRYYMVKIENMSGDICSVVNGLGQHFAVEREMLQPVIKGEQVRRYFIDRLAALFIIYPYRVVSDEHAVLIEPGELEERFPKTWEYLQVYREVLGARDMGKWNRRLDWYAYARSQNIATFMGPKFLIPYMTTRLRTAYDEGGQFFFVNITTGGYGLRVDSAQYRMEYFLGILNSTLLSHCIRQMTNQFRGGYFAVNKQALERLPFRPINFSDPSDRLRHDRLVELVDWMQSLHRRVAVARTNGDKTILQRQIDAIDHQIDALVYELYGVTDEEIAVVEAAIS